MATMAFMALKSAGGSTIFAINAMEIVSKIVTKFQEGCITDGIFSIEGRAYYFATNLYR
jgi:hypothetical protein